MVYSDFTLDQLMKYKEYINICNKFLSLPIDDKTKEKLESVLYKGGYKNYKPSGGIGKNNPIIEIQRRISLAYLIIRNPETFNQIVNHNIVYFHGTNAKALKEIIKYGLKSVDSLVEEGKKVNTGEKWSRINGKRDFISFTDVLDISEDYSTIDVNKVYFPVIIGTTKEDVISSFGCAISSDYPEIGIPGSFPKESIRVIMVPPSKVEVVRNLVDNNIIVLAVDDIGDKFYNIQSDIFELYIDEIKFQKLKNNIDLKSQFETGLDNEYEIKHR